MEPSNSVKAIQPVGEYTAEKFEMNFGAATSLAPFTARYKFFSPALLYLFGRFNDGPLVDFAAEDKPKYLYLYRKFDTKIFSGMDCGYDPSWNYVLWGMPLDYWPAFESFMLSLALYDPAEQNVYRVGAQDVHIFDPIAKAGTQIAGLEIVVFGINGSRGCVALANDGIGLPTVRRYPTQADTRAFASALFSADDPVAAVAAITPETPLPETSLPPLRTVPLAQMAPAKRLEYETLLRLYRKFN
jgi:hypothetical protein